MKAAHNCSERPVSLMRPGLKGFTGLYGALVFCVLRVPPAIPSHLKMTPETDLHERRYAAPRHIPPFMGGRLPADAGRFRFGANVTIITAARSELA